MISRVVVVGMKITVSQDIGIYVTHKHTFSQIATIGLSKSGTTFGNFNQFSITFDVCYLEYIHNHSNDCKAVISMFLN